MEDMQLLRYVTPPNQTGVKQLLTAVNKANVWASGVRAIASGHQNSLNLTFSKCNRTLSAEIS